MSAIMDKCGNIFKVAYCPEFSSKFELFIKDKCSCSMESDDSIQFLMDRITDAIEEHKFKMEESDNEIFRFLNDNLNVVYIELEK